MSDVIVAPNMRDLAVLAADLAEWMRGKLPGASDLRIDNLDYPRGAGQSHETILFDAHWREGGADRARGCVVRIKPTSFTVFPDNLFEEQYRVMKALHANSEVIIAEPLWFEEDDSILGQPFFVMEKKKGRVPVSVPPYAMTGWLAEATPAQRRHLWEGSVRQLALIQHVPVAGLDFLAGPAHARDGLAQEWDKYTRFVAWLKDDPRAELLERALQRLRSCWPDNQPEGLVWGDARIGNMMYDENFDVVAVMDWEQPSLGGALHDLAWFCTVSEMMHGGQSMLGSLLEGMGTREETVALWEEISGKSAADFGWYLDFTQLKLMCTGTRMDMLRGTDNLKVDSLKAALKLG